MGLELPGWLTEPLSWIGLIWPQADEDKLFSDGETWIGFSAALSSICDNADQAAKAVWSTGDTVDDQAINAFEKWWTADDGPDARLTEDEVASAIMGAALIVFAGITLALKIAFIAQLIMLAIEVAQAIATAFATFGATAAEVPGFIAATRVVCRQLIRQVVEHITTVVKDLLDRAKNLFKKVESKLAQRAERKAAEKAAEEAALRRARELVLHHTNSTPEDFAREFPELAHGVNPRFGEAGFDNNCQSCVVATDRSLAGYPSSAIRRPPGNDPRFEWPGSAYNGTGTPYPLRTASGYQDIANEMYRAGPGARGIIHGMRNGQAGHVFNVVNRNGQIAFLDGQIGGFAFLEKFDGFQFLRTF